MINQLFFRQHGASKGRPLLTLAVLVGLAISIAIFVSDFMHQNSMRETKWSDPDWILYEKTVDLREDSSVADVFREVITLVICRSSQFTQKPETANVGRSAQLDVSIRNVGSKAVETMLEDLAEAFEGEPDAIDPSFDGTIVWENNTPALAERLRDALDVLDAGGFKPPQTLDIQFLNANWQPNPNGQQSRPVSDGFAQSWTWVLSQVVYEGTSSPELPVQVAFQYDVDGKTYEAQQILSAKLSTSHRFSDWIDAFFSRIQQLQLLLIGLLLPLVRFAPEAWSKWRKPKEA